MVFMNYYSGCGHFMKHIICYIWNKNTAIHVYDNNVLYVNGIQYSFQRMTGIWRIFGMVYLFLFSFEVDVPKYLSIREYTKQFINILNN